MTKFAVSLVLAACIGCGADVTTPPDQTRGLKVSTDPEGANVLIDGVATGQVTPVSFADLTGSHEIGVKLTIDEVEYGFRTRVDIQGDSLHRLFGPLTMRCVSADCARNIAKYFEFGAMRAAVNPNGALFLYDGGGNGLQWPAGTTGTYAAMGLPLIAMMDQPGDTLALGLYNLDYLAGRPDRKVTTSGGRTILRQSFWVVPPLEVILLQYPSVRGIEVSEEVIGKTGEDVTYVKLTYRNVTDRASYRAADPVVEEPGVTFTQVYAGFAIDADIGRGDDDLLTYEPSLDMLYMYDGDFSEASFDATRRSKPGILGLRLLSVSDPHALRVLSAWPVGSLSAVGDWDSGTYTEAAGWRVLSGTRAPAPDYPGQQIGFVPTTPADYRMAVSAGPFTLAPGQSVSITVAVVLAEPVSGTYTIGQFVSPGDPLDGSRVIRQVAGNLINRVKNLNVP